MAKRILFICKAVKWWDKVNGNTYHSCRITRVRDGATLCAEFQYGYGDQYRQTAVDAMLAAGWLRRYKVQGGRDAGKTYDHQSVYGFDREHGYCIYWDESHATKRECVANGRPQGW